MKTFQSQSYKLEEEIISEASMDSENVINKYDKSFHIFMDRNIDRSKTTSMIYGVSINGRKLIGYFRKEKPISKSKGKPKALHSHFSYACTQNDYSVPRPKLSKNSRKTN